MEKNYEAPQVEVVEVEVEKGFATSSIPVNPGGSGSGAAPGSRGDWDDIW